MALPPSTPLSERMASAVPEAALPAPSVEVEEEELGFSQYTEVQPAQPVVDGESRSLVLTQLSVLPSSVARRSEPSLSDSSAHHSS